MTVHGKDYESEKFGSSQIDEAAALAALDNSRELLNDLAQIFVEDMPELFRDLEAAVASRDAPTVHRVTHSIKGLASSFFAKPTVDLARQLEKEARDGDLSTFDCGGAEQLKILVNDLIDELRSRGLINS